MPVNKYFQSGVPGGRSSEQLVLEDLIADLKHRIMLYIVYKTTNTLNSHYYIGVHGTYNINDGYLGSGKYFKYALKKYGRESFYRDIIEIFVNRDDAYFLESKLVTEEVINDPTCYNFKIGGSGGKGLCGQNNGFYGKKHKQQTKQIMSEKAKLRISKKPFPSKSGITLTTNHKEKIRKAILGIRRSEETKKKMSDAAIKRWNHVSG